MSFPHIHLIKFTFQDKNQDYLNEIYRYKIQNKNTRWLKRSLDINYIGFLYQYYTKYI